MELVKLFVRLVAWLIESIFNTVSDGVGNGLLHLDGSGHCCCFRHIDVVSSLLLEHGS